MKKLIITVEQADKIAQLLSNTPTSVGLPIIDILRSLPEAKPEYISPNKEAIEKTS